MEVTENLNLIREYLLNNNNITCPGDGQVKSNRQDGKGGGVEEIGSVRNISAWLNKQGEVNLFKY